MTDQNWKKMKDKFDETAPNVQIRYSGEVQEGRLQFLFFPDGTTYSDLSEVKDKLHKAGGILGNDLKLSFDFNHMSLFTQTASSCVIGQGSYSKMNYPLPDKVSSVVSIKLDEFIDWLKSAKLIVDGDQREQLFIRENLNKLFKNYEALWKLIIIPATKRIHLYPGPLTADIDFRDNVSVDVLRLAQFHYSVMRSLVNAWWHMNSTHDSRYQDFFMHLVNACEQVQLFLLAWSVVVEGALPWSEVLRQTENLRNEEARCNLLKDKLSPLKTKMADFRSAHNQAGEARNALVHGPQIPEVLSESGLRVPRVSSIQRLIEWPDFCQLDKEKLEKLFVEPDKEMAENFVNVSKKINALWEPLSDIFIERLKRRRELQEAYQLKLE